jgi:hypothetical protein
MAKYYTLFIFDADAGQWADEFGDYSRATVQGEYDETFYNLPKAFKKIIAWDDEKHNPAEFIANKNRELNGETMPPAETWVLKDGPYFVASPPQWNRWTHQGVTVSEFEYHALTFSSKEQAGEWLATVRMKQRERWNLPAYKLAQARAVQIHAGA